MTEPKLPKFDPAAQSRFVDQGLSNLTPIRAWQVWMAEYRPLGQKGFAILESPATPIIRDQIARRRFLQAVLICVAGVCIALAAITALWPPAGDSPGDLHDQRHRISQQRDPQVHTRNRKIYPNEESALKLVFMAVREASKKWTKPIHHLKEALNHFAILYEGRVPESNRLKPDGIVGPNTMGKLFEEEQLLITLALVPRQASTIGGPRRGIQPPRLIPPLTLPPLTPPSGDPFLFAARPIV